METSVVDPDSLNLDPDMDPDHAFQVNPGTKNLKKKISIFIEQNCNLLIPRPSSRTSKLQEKPSALKREHPALLESDPIWIHNID
jgi:hypothetical protein